MRQGDESGNLRETRFVPATALSFVRSKQGDLRSGSARARLAVQTCASDACAVSIPEPETNAAWTAPARAAAERRVE